ncbi:MAG: UDP-glucose 6-dehydrogenase [Acidimicrobiaceae bacterium]|nr:UDP-glucose 6-dehydrogenase [Acidimicrobiaceae bacterium]MEC9059042.1 UDP-glucose/GDP-mannose dehydrogenase family protein [Actinomycetota bacterium]MEC9473837.1 UDP-glucose/GDP-mannose dehydrogenase family protein [Actinomycetota bacterium]
MSNVTVIGAGYVGLTTATCLAHLGHTVTCVDIDEAKVGQLNNGQVPIHEARLPELLQDGLSKQVLKFVVGASQAVTASEFVFLCLPTPQGDDGRVDISAISTVIEEIREVIPPGSTIVNKSTTPVGTNASIQSSLQRDDVAVVSNPEFLREGVAVTDFLQPDRIVIGATDPEAAQRVISLYDSIDAPIVNVDPPSAETIKYATNSFLATKVSFVNALAAVCEAVGADIESVTRGLGADQRIGSRFLQPGPGWGGSCFPKDMQALVRMATDAGYQFDLLRAVIEANEQQFERIVAKAEQLIDGSLEGVNVTLLGLTFKAHTDDLRNSPAIEIANLLIAKGAKLTAYDPMVESPAGLPEEINLVRTTEQAVARSDLTLILTEWPEFTRANWGALRDSMTVPRVLDARNALDRSAMVELGFQYDDLGRT